MRRVRILFVLATAVTLAVTLNLAGCTKKPSQDELSKLEQARSAAESAEKKLSELRTERQQLEQQLEAKKGDLKGAETERNQVKAKMGQPAADTTHPAPASKK
jgi:septal ring factor EnvC (AmiA/AmiB activator)